MSDILATKDIASQPPERQPTETPNAHAKIDPKGTLFFNSNFFSTAKFHPGCRTHFL